MNEKNIDQIKNKLGTKEEITWCPGCADFMILESVKQAISKLISEGLKYENVAMSCGIGCHSKIFDYLNISGIYGLHGRALPVALGMKLGNPNLKVIVFSGDGDTYAEGIEHFIHASRYNADMTLLVNDNQSFSLTTGQSTPTSQQGYISKAEPLGEFNRPLNPLKLALAAGCTFIARCNPRDIAHTAEVIEKAMKHRGFSYVEIMQHCLVFNTDTAIEDKLMYKVENKDKKNAENLADEWDYNSKTGKIPIGIIYQEERKVLEDQWPQLKKLEDSGKSWKNL